MRAKLRLVRVHRDVGPLVVLWRCAPRASEQPAPRRTLSAKAGGAGRPTALRWRRAADAGNQLTPPDPERLERAQRIAGDIRKIAEHLEHRYTCRRVAMMLARAARV